MNKTEFVEKIKQSIVDGVAESVEDELTSPPGRYPDLPYIERSDWFNALGDQDRKRVLEVVKISTFAAMFHFFCILDGVGFIEYEMGEKGIFKLYYEHESKGEKVLLNGTIDPEGDLHDILKSLE